MRKQTSPVKTEQHNITVPFNIMEVFTIQDFETDSRQVNKTTE